MVGRDRRARPMFKNSPPLPDGPAVRLGRVNQDQGGIRGIIKIAGSQQQGQRESERGSELDHGLFGFYLNHATRFLPHSKTLNYKCGSATLM